MPKEQPLQDCTLVAPIGNISNDLEAFKLRIIRITDINRSENLKVTSCNIGLSLNFVPVARERLVANKAVNSLSSGLINTHEIAVDNSHHQTGKRNGPNQANAEWQSTKQRNYAYDKKQSEDSEPAGRHCLA